VDPADDLTMTPTAEAAQRLGMKIQDGRHVLSVRANFLRIKVYCCRAHIALEVVKKRIGGNGREFEGHPVDYVNGSRSILYQTYDDPEEEDDDDDDEDDD